MNVANYIASGILDAYCMGKLSDDTCMEVELYAKEYPEINIELKRIHDSLEFYATANSLAPHASVKTKLLLRVYEEQCGAGKKYPPLIKENIRAVDFKDWLAGFTITQPAEPYDNLVTFDLPSTETVTNFVVWAKQGHEEEEHDSFNEYIVILKGHCDMYFGGEKKHYNTGDIIFIPPFIPHTAVITSDEPMVAVVQRQLIAA